MDRILYINSYEYFYHNNMNTFTHYHSLSQKFLKVCIILSLDNIPTKPKTYWKRNYLEHENTKIFEKIIEPN